MSEPSRKSWGALLRGVPVTAPDGNVEMHPNARLDKQAERLTAARSTVLQLDMSIKANDMRFQTTLADIEKHYHEQVDSVETQYRTEADELATKYAAAYSALMREQASMTEMLKHVDCRAEFVNHFPPPKADGDE